LKERNEKSLRTNMILSYRWLKAKEINFVKLT